jgi:hypothetical protein
MKEYRINGKRFLIHDDALFVEADYIGEVLTHLSPLEEVPELKPVKRHYKKRQPRDPQFEKFTHGKGVKRLSPEVKDLILKEVKGGVKTKAEIAKEYEISEATVYAIIKKSKATKIGGHTEEKKDNFGGNKPVEITCAACVKKFSARPHDGKVICPECGEENILTDLDTKF